MFKIVLQCFNSAVKLVVDLIISFALLQEDHERHDFQREQVGGIADCGPVLQDDGKEFVENELVAAAKRIIERPQFGKLAQNELCGGRKCAAHGC